MTITAGDTHVLALAERFAPYAKAMRGAIAYAADAGDADRVAIYTDVSRGVESGCRPWTRISTRERD